MSTRRISQSEIGCFLQCRRKHYWRYVKHLAPLKTPLPLAVGSAVHEGLALFYRGAEPRKIIKVMTKKVTELRKTVFVPPDETFDFDEQEQAILGMLEGYFARYKHDPERWVYDPDDDVECRFEVPLLYHNGVKVVFMGYLDLRAKSKKTGKPVLFEHKTVKDFSSLGSNDLALDYQMGLYTWGQRKLTGEKYNTVVYNAIRKPTIHRRKKETTEQYFLRLSKDCLDRPSFYFGRTMPQFSPERLKRLLAWSRAIVKDIIDLQTDGDMTSYYPSTYVCSRFGNCEYLPLCSCGPRADILRMFQQRQGRR